MGFYEEALAIQPGMSGPDCAVGLILKGDDTELAEGLAETLADEHVLRVQVSDALKQRGYKISANTVSHHIRGRCRCETTS